MDAAEVLRGGPHLQVRRRRRGPQRHHVSDVRDVLGSGQGLQGGPTYGVYHSSFKPNK